MELDLPHKQATLSFAFAIIFLPLEPFHDLMMGGSPGGAHPLRTHQGKALIDGISANIQFQRNPRNLTLELEGKEIPRRVDLPLPKPPAHMHL